MSGPILHPILDEVDLVVFDKDGTLISFEAMWVGWALDLGTRLEIATRRPVAGDVFTTIGFDPVAKRILPGGPLAIETMSGIEQLIAAVRIVAAGDALIAPAITKRLIAQFARTAPPLTPNPNLSQLTPRELEVLSLIARGLANAEIAAELVVSEATIKTHVTRVLSKLNLRDRVQAVVLAYETGLVSPGNNST